MMLSCVHDLCHAGCARLAGQKMTNKNDFFCFGGRWHGNLPGSPLLCVRLFFLIPFPLDLLLFIPINNAQRGIYSTKDHFLWPLNGFVLNWKKLSYPFRGLHDVKMQPSLSRIVLISKDLRFFNTLHLKEVHAEL